MYNLCMNCASLDCVSWTSTTPVGLQSHLPSVELYQYSSEDIAGLNNKIPSLFAVQGTAKFHEFFTKKEGEKVYLFVKNIPMRRVEKLPWTYYNKWSYWRKWRRTRWGAWCFKQEWQWWIWLWLRYKSF